eukprot:Rmarinus@m.9886
MDVSCIIVQRENSERAYYTRCALESCFQLMGCKPMQAHDLVEALFKVCRGHGAEIQEGQRLITSEKFQELVQQMVGPTNTSEFPVLDFRMACAVRERRQPIVILLGGTSGCGKSTLASLLAHRLSIPTVVSTDSIRHTLRNFISEEACPALHSSTYHAGEKIFPPDSDVPYKKQIIRGYKTQSEVVMKNVIELIERFYSRGESLIVEGVHLSPKYMVEVMRLHTGCIPFLVFISNVAKHRERFAVRAKYMTLEPRHNKYVRYLKNIRIIQDHFCKRAERYRIPMLDNTNIDRSLAKMHTTICQCISIVACGGSLFDQSDNVSKNLADAYEAAQSGRWSSKDMLRVIREKKGDSMAAKRRKDVVDGVALPRVDDVLPPRNTANSTAAVAKWLQDMEDYLPLGVSESSTRTPDLRPYAGDFSTHSSSVSPGTTDALAALRQSDGRKGSLVAESTNNAMVHTLGSGAMVSPGRRLSTSPTTASNTPGGSALATDPTLPCPSNCLTHSLGLPDPQRISPIALPRAFGEMDTNGLIQSGTVLELSSSLERSEKGRGTSSTTGVEHDSASHIGRMGEGQAG